MKKSIVLSLAIFAMLLSGCKKETTTETTTETTEQTVPVAEDVLPETPKSECYSVTKGSTVISMELNYDGDNASGTLNYGIAEKDKNTGTFVGTIKDSILVADYTFQSEGVESTRQIAYKFKGNQIVEGYGDMNADGTRFKDVSKLNFDGKMPLVKVDCAK